MSDNHVKTYLDSTITTLAIFDGNWIAARAFYGYPDPDVGLLHGFFYSISKTLKYLNPTHIIFTFDSTEKTWRHYIYPEYKANRHKRDKGESYDRQFKTIIQLLKDINFIVLSADSYEADDIIYTIIQRCKSEMDDLIIVTRDKDMMALVHNKNKIKVYDDMANILYDKQKVLDKFGVLPVKIQDYLALVGDASDNIPGCAKVGPKTAIKILETANFIENLTEDHKKSYELSKRLVEFKEVDNLSFNIEDCSVDKINNRAFRVHKTVPMPSYFFRFNKQSRE